MTSFFSVDDIKALQNLLTNNTGESSDDDDEPQLPNLAQNIGPADIGPRARPTAREEKDKKRAEVANIATKQKPSDLAEELAKWEKEEEEVNKLLIDSRKRPEITYSYSQSVGTEDVFLQLGNKTPSTSSCKTLIMDINLVDDETPLHKFQMEFTEVDIELQTDKYYLKELLPNKVDPNSAKATYNSETKLLRIRLAMEREFDYLNL